MFNADVPRFECLLRAEFLYDLKSHHGELVPVVVFGISSIPGRAIGWHVMTDVGAVIWRLPIHALCWKAGAPKRTLDDLELWDAFSYHASVHEFSWLAGSRCLAALKSGDNAEGQYLFTIDWVGSSEAENPGDIGHKCAHVLKLDEGNFAALPNNRILWASPSFVSKPFEARPDYITNTHIWRCEGARKWGTEPTNKMFYGVS